MITLLIIFILIILVFYFYSHDYFEGFDDLDNKNMPPIYVINLKHRADRKHRTEEQLTKHGLTGKFIEAVNGSYLDINKLEDDGYLNVKRKRMRRGEIGCYLSHIKCWLEILKSNAPMGLIFEDDIILKSDFVPTLSKMLVSVKDKEWDLFYLGRICYGNAWFNELSCITGENVADDIIYPKTVGWGNHAYIIKRETVRKLISEMFPINLPIDWMLPDLYHKKVIKTLGLKKDIVRFSSNKDSDTRRIK